jgi:hypothetical protein
MASQLGRVARPILFLMARTPRHHPEEHPMRFSIDRSVTFLIALIAVTGLLAGAASAQIVRTSTTTRTATDTSNTLQKVTLDSRQLEPIGDPAESSGPAAQAFDGDATQGLEYLHRPDFIYVAQVSDYIDDPGEGGWVDTTLDLRSLRLHMSALNGSQQHANVRIQLFDDSARRWLETDHIIAPGHRRALVDPHLPSEFGSTYDESNMPTVFIVSSNEPVKLDGRIVANSDYWASSKTSESESNRRVAFEAVDCDEPGNAWICRQWVLFNAWPTWAD